MDDDDFLPWQLRALWEEETIAYLAYRATVRDDDLAREAGFTNE